MSGYIGSKKQIALYDAYGREQVDGMLRNGDMIGGIRSLYKIDYRSPCFKKASASSLQIKEGTRVYLKDGKPITFYSDTTVSIPTLSPGEDYSIWVTDGGSVEAVLEDDPSSPDVRQHSDQNARCVGGFHYGLMDEAETVSSGSFSTTSPSMIWTQEDVDKIRGINEFSIWDILWRCKTDDMRGQRGHAFDPYSRKWVGIYFINTDTDSNGLSRAGSDIASGTVDAKIPRAFGGDGTVDYSSISGTDFFAFNDITSAYGLRQPWYNEFMSYAFGVTEGQSIGGASETYPITERNSGYTSRIGIEQATGHQQIWGLDSSVRVDKGTDGGSWRNVVGGRGELFSSGLNGEAQIQVRHGGNRSHGASSGSRSSVWNFWPWHLGWGFSARSLGDHLEPEA